MPFAGGGGGHGGGGGGHHGGGHGGGGFRRGGGGGFRRGGGGWWGGYGPGWWDYPTDVIVTEDNPCTQPWRYTDPARACEAYQAQQMSRIAGFGSVTDDFKAGGWKWFVGGVVAAVVVRGIL